MVINQQVQQREERKKESQQEKGATGLQRSRSLRMKGEGSKGFLSFFKDI